MNARFYIIIFMLILSWGVLCLLGFERYNYVVHLLLIAAFVTVIVCAIRERYKIINHKK